RAQIYPRLDHWSPETHFLLRSWCWLGRGGWAQGLGGGSSGENGRVLLSEIAEVSRAVAGTSARLAKIETLAGALREAGPLEVPIAVAYLSGELPQRQIGVGWAALRDGFAPADVSTLTLSDV